MQNIKRYAHYPGILLSVTLYLSSLKICKSITILELHLKYSTQ